MAFCQTFFLKFRRSGKGLWGRGLCKTKGIWRSVVYAWKVIQKMVSTRCHIFFKKKRKSKSGVHPRVSALIQPSFQKKGKKQIGTTLFPIIRKKLDITSPHNAKCLVCRIGLFVRNVVTFIIQKAVIRSSPYSRFFVALKRTKKRRKRRRRKNGFNP